MSFLGFHSPRLGGEGWLFYFCDLLNVTFFCCHSLSLPQSAVGWSLVYEYGISWLYSYSVFISVKIDILVSYIFFCEKL